MVALKEALEPRKRGPKFKHPQKTPEENIRDLREKIDRLKDYLEGKEKQIHLLREKLEPQKDDLRPVRCPNCGCEKVYRNSTYKIKPKGFFDNLKTRKEELIQRFICPYCGKSFHIKKQNFPHAHIRDEVRRAIEIFRVDGKTSLRALQGCIHKVLYVDISLGFIYGELRRASQIAERINLKVFSLIDLSHCVMDEVWIKVAKTNEAWNFGFLAASPKSLFISFFDYVARRDEPSMGIKVLDHKERGFNPSILTS